jgi:hypothetical protein
MTTSQQQADELLRIAPELCLDMKEEKINKGATTIQCVESGVHSTAPQPESDPQAPLFGKVDTRAKRLPRYVERNRCNGNLSFRVDRSARILLPKDPTTPEFRAAYNAALVDAIAAEDQASRKELSHE